MKTFRLLVLLSFLSVLLSGQKKNAGPIDRFALVTRHNVYNEVIDSLSPLSVGNGSFAFTVDITGLQTFPDYYSRGISLGTMSEWGWNSAGNPENYSLSDVLRTYQVHGRQVDYVHQFRSGEGARKAAASEWLRVNPHKSHLGMIGLQILKKDGTEISLRDIEMKMQSLYLWTGTIESNYSVEKVPVNVLTVCHPGTDMISARIKTGLIKDKRLNVKLSFPVGTSSQTGYTFSSPEKHLTEILSSNDTVTVFRRSQDNEIYYVKVFHRKGKIVRSQPHVYLLETPADSVFEFSCQFSKEIPDQSVCDFETTRAASLESWQKFWSEGGAVDFSQCTDPRASELERRVILSRYLTRIQCSGSLPPAETGLTYNTWYGKFHLEMHWWHAVHFALWQKNGILEKQMEYYNRISGNARNTAEHQGYKGVRWPKMTDPKGRESPSAVGTYLIWQQPHPIFFAELLYINSSDRKSVLQKYSDIVFQTAEFMASYAWYDARRDRYQLGPVLIPAQESLNKETTINPPFELVYWYWGLKTAQEWRKRLGMKPEPHWNDVIRKLSGLPVQDGLYLCSEDTKDSYTNQRYLSDHPIVSGIQGVLPATKLVDPKILCNSLDTIAKKWNWNTTWGWDFPMLAMSAASVGRSSQAIDFLMMEAPKNRYLLNGHNFQDATRLMIYLPGNGGLLTAVAKMCVQDQFPHDGKWNVKWEGLNLYIK